MAEANRERSSRRVLMRLGLAAIGLVLLAAVGGLVHLHRIANAGEEPDFFESEIQAFEEADRHHTPPSGGIVFIGSSSIRFWKSLAEDFAPLPVINRGFGGAQFNHVTYNARRIVLPYAPRAIVVYAGDNDLGANTGKDAGRVIRDFKEFAELVRSELPGTDLYILSIKPSPLRWDRWAEMTRANEGLAAIAAGDPRLHYVDVATPLLGDDGKPRSDFFWIDGLHLNAAGYEAWTSVLRPILASAYAKS